MDGITGPGGPSAQEFTVSLTPPTSRGNGHDAVANLVNIGGGANTAGGDGPPAVTGDTTDVATHPVDYSIESNVVQALKSGASGEIIHQMQLDHVDASNPVLFAVVSLLLETYQDLTSSKTDAAADNDIGEDGVASSAGSVSGQTGAEASAKANKAARVGANEGASKTATVGCTPNPWQAGNSFNAYQLNIQEMMQMLKENKAVQAEVAIIATNMIYAMAETVSSLIGAAAQTEIDKLTIDITKQAVEMGFTAVTTAVSVLATAGAFDEKPVQPVLETNAPVTPLEELEEVPKGGDLNAAGHTADEAVANNQEITSRNDLIEGNNKTITSKMDAIKVNNSEIEKLEKKYFKGDDIKKLKAENEGLRKECTELKSKNENLAIESQKIKANNPVGVKPLEGKLAEKVADPAEATKANNAIKDTNKKIGQTNTETANENRGITNRNDKIRDHNFKKQQTLNILAQSIDHVVKNTTGIASDMVNKKAVGEKAVIDGMQEMSRALSSVYSTQLNTSSDALKTNSQLLDQVLQSFDSSMGKAGEAKAASMRR